MKCRVIAVLGTRPEAIKLALVIQELRRRSDEFETAVVHTGQHRTMLDHALKLFHIKPDFDLDVMRPNQTLNSLTCRVLDTVENACHRFEPHMVLVQGDTTTAFASALASYYSKIPVGHIEAGLRSGDIYNPFPEEVNRRLVSVVTQIHFAPTAQSRDNLLAEGVPDEKIVVTGNTVIDTLRALGELPEHSWVGTPLENIPTDGSRLVLVTSHRRESLGADQEHMCLALKDLVQKHPDIRVIYPVHMNPNVRSTVNGLLQGTDRIHLTEPLDYVTFVSLLRKCFLVLTDSAEFRKKHQPLESQCWSCVKSPNVLRRRSLAWPGSSACRATQSSAKPIAFLQIPTPILICRKAKIPMETVADLSVSSKQSHDGTLTKRPCSMLTSSSNCRRGRNPAGARLT